MATKDCATTTTTTCCTLVLRICAGLLLIGLLVVCLVVWRHMPEGHGKTDQRLQAVEQQDAEKCPVKEGPPGERGETGPKGEKGARGFSGLDGSAGEKGDKGRLGSSGEPGPRGFSVKGEKGAAGKNCECGEQVHGMPGIPGAKGERGSPGLHGMRGDKGDSGLPGLHGVPGVQGPPGAKGDQSAPGNIRQEGLPKTCVELAESRTDLVSGYYVIDPNVGDPDDAIEVFCDLANTPRTCFGATSSPDDDDEDKELIDGPPSDGRPILWMSSLLGTSWLLDTYAPIRHQMPSLQALSRRARQSLTYHCWNSVAYQSPNGSYAQGLTLVGWNEAEVHPDPERRLHYNTAHDGCRDAVEKKAQTMLYFETAHPFTLPFIDVGLRDATALAGDDAPKRFLIEMGRLCFY